MLSERIESVVDYIEKSIGKPLSRLKIGVLSHAAITELSKFEIVYLEGNAESDLTFYEVIYKTKSDFYIYVKNNLNNMIVEGVILFEPNKLEEVKFNIIRLKKIK